MAGNVREWVSNSFTDDYSKGILGGSYADDSYVPFDFFSQNAWDRSSYNGVRLVKKLEADNSGEIFYKRENLRNFYENFQTTEKEWKLIKSLYLYDKESISFKDLAVTKVADRDYFCHSSDIIYDNPYYQFTIYRQTLI